MRTTGLVVAYLVCIVWQVATAQSACPSGSTSATLHLTSSNCTGNQLTGFDSILTACGRAYTVTTDKQGSIRFAPVRATTYDFVSYPGVNQSFPCANATARGVVRDPKKPNTAAVQLWRDLYSGESVLAATGPDTLQLMAYGFSPPKGPGPYDCTFDYKVTEGCLLGAKASGAKFTCPVGTARKPGRAAGLFYCELCPYNTYATAGATSCTPCPAASKRKGLSADILKQCPNCLDTGLCSSGCGADNQYRDASNRCKDCPAGSYLTPRADACAICREGRRCCVVHPDATCPPCPAGAKGVPLTMSFAATSVTGGSAWEACKASGAYVCLAQTTITVRGDCRLEVATPAGTAESRYRELLTHNPLPPQPSGPTSQSETNACANYPISGLLDYRYTVQNSGAFSMQTDIINKVFATPGGTNYTPPATNFTGPYMDLKYPNSTCVTRHRLLSASNPSLLPIKPSPACPPASPECPKTCAAGSYTRKLPTGAQACLPCPAGTYSDKPNSAACTPCKPGSAAFGLGNTRCQQCPSGTVAGTAAASICSDCGTWRAASGGTVCTECPFATYGIAGGCYKGAGTQLCCAVGDCGSGIPACPANPPAPVLAPALFKLTSKSAACATYPLAACISTGDMMYAWGNAPSGASGVSFAVLGGSSSGVCAKDGMRDLQYQELASANSVAIFKWQDTGPIAGSAVADPKSATLTLTLYEEMYPSSPYYRIPLPACTASFSLVSGSILGLKKSATSCPPGLLLTAYPGYKACLSCGPGNALIGGKCTPCPPGTYTDKHAATSCATCPPGFAAGADSSPTGSATCFACWAGTAPVKGKSECQQCPVNTYARRKSASCLPCPPGTSTQGRTGAPLCVFT